jgi:hypothetical protein
MLLTFFCACLAYIGTYLANGIGMLTAQGHQIGSCPANGCTFHIQADTLRHGFHIPFLQAVGSAVIAHRHTMEAGFNTGSII